MSESEVIAELLPEDGTFPNNERLPVLIYRRAVDLPPEDPAAIFERIFNQNGWLGSWRDGIYFYHHYHSTAHEVLGIARGTARLQLGGEDGLVLEVSPGDVVVIPAGVAHKNLGSSSDFLVVGAYPEGQDWDMNYGRPGERPAADHNLERVPLPRTDPLGGNGGLLLHNWRPLRKLDRP